MADRGLIDQLVADGVTRSEAEWAADKVLGAVLSRLREGRTVQIDGVGRLGAKATTKDCYCDGPGRVDVKVACLKTPVELSRGEPRRAVSR